MPIPQINYNSGIPNPPNNPSVDVTPMQQNTAFIEQIVDVDLIGFGIPGSGSHAQANFLETSTSGTPSLPGIVGGAGYATLYSSAVDPTLGLQNIATALVKEAELLFTREATGTQIQLTGPGTPVQSASNGMTFLPGGILIQWGNDSISGSSTPVTFSPAFPNKLFFVIAQTIGSSAGQLNGVSYGTSGGNETGFNFFIVEPITGPASFVWVAIGF